MLGHRLRRCPNINPALAKYIAFAGSARLNKYEIFICRCDVDRTLKQDRLNAFVFWGYANFALSHWWPTAATYM